jgi:hypothetical protein
LVVDVVKSSVGMRELDESPTTSGLADVVVQTISKYRVFKMLGRLRQFLHNRSFRCLIYLLKPLNQIKASQTSTALTTTPTVIAHIRFRPSYRQWLHIGGFVTNKVSK